MFSLFFFFFSLLFYICPYTRQTNHTLRSFIQFIPSYFLSTVLRPAFEICAKFVTV